MNTTLNTWSLKLHDFFNKPFFKNPWTVYGLWLLLGVCSCVFKLNAHNNYDIFCGVFNHTFAQTPLYIEYPNEYFDVNHYGPLFSLIIGPFALLPTHLGLLFWNMSLAALLCWAVRKCDVLTWSQQLFIYWFCAHELLTALFMQQYNIAIAAGILLTFYFIEKEKDCWAAFWIVLGTLVKLYGIVGLAFFFFSKHKGKFILYLLLWSVILFVAPMLISSPEYIIEQYKEWIICLGEKNDGNINIVGLTNISLLGMIRRMSGCFTYSDLWVIVPGLALFAAPYLRFKQYKNLNFRLTYLASVLMFTILFSTGSESSGYITALIGTVIWYCCGPTKRNGWDIALMVFVFILSSMSPSDLFPRYLRETYVIPYSLKALPVTLVWFKLCYEMLFRNYSQNSECKTE